MTINPQGNIYLCKTPLENDYKNQLTFSNANSQLNYFNSTIQVTLSNYTYIKKDNVIKVDKNIDEIIDCNYLFYRNNGFTAKYYYCFITNMEYINENCTAITIETDCFQTWQFQINYKRCFVEREHVSDDSVGTHTIPEGLETGEYVTNYQDYYNGLDDLKYVIQCTEWASNDDKPLATNYGGVFMAGGAYVCSSIVEVVNILQLFAQNAKSEAVYSLYMVPAKFITTSSESLQYPGQNNPLYDTKVISKDNNLNGYVPVNNKLLTFPYRYMSISNNNGSSNILHYERFSGNNCNFMIKGVPSVGGSIKLVASNYDIVNNEENGLIAGKLPTLNWSEDSYTNWLTQNSVNIGLGIASAGISLVSGAISKNAGNVISSGMDIANQLASVYQHSLQPNSARGSVNAGDINVCDKKNGFFFYKMSIKPEYARVIDNYFSMFGYKVNILKVPNVTGRSNWNYVKTIDCNFDGNIPQTDLNIIRNMFNQGCTFWHNSNTMYDYSQSNAIV